MIGIQRRQLKPCIRLCHCHADEVESGSIEDFNFLQESVADLVRTVKTALINSQYLTSWTADPKMKALTLKAVASQLTQLMIDALREIRIYVFGRESLPKKP